MLLTCIVINMGLDKSASEGRLFKIYNVWEIVVAY